MRTNSQRNHEQGIILTLVAVFMLFVVGAMAALSIDAVTLYTARSEAQLAADAAALAGARVLANSGMTSDPTAATDNLMTNAQTLAQALAIQVAQSNQVGGRALVAANGEVVVTTPCTEVTNPCVTVKVQRTDLPTFFARIWGSKQLTVAASATAEAYNPSGANKLGVTVVAPVAPSCVKPWVLPNLSPNGAPSIIDRTTGAIVDTTLLGATPTTLLQSLCQPSTCVSNALGTPQAWNYYSEDVSSLPAAGALPACAAGFKATQNGMAGCIQTPIACGSGSKVNLEKIHGNLRSETADAVNCLIHASTSATTADTIDPSYGPSWETPFHFQAGTDNPLVQAGAVSVNTDVMVSDSIVTVPIYDDGNLTVSPTSPVPIVGFLQVFLSPTGAAIPTSGSNLGAMSTTVINIAGCGTSAGGQPILGNGASPVTVRLISPSS